MKLLELNNKINLLLEGDDISKKELLNTVNALMKNYKVDTEHDIPYLAGYSKDGTTIYLDKELPKFFVDSKKKKLDVHKAVIFHEIMEKSMALHNRSKDFKYTQAHQIACRMERDYVEAMGVSEKEYDAFTLIYVKKCRERKEYTNLPKDLDVTPYVDDKDEFLLKKMKAIL